ncbi:hypothetical protein ACQ86G_21450 [Roseateles chitinivorans]|uniref:hypothetical protein n=1 Tax=Roseateles chitinivorans TaxID=2917965 RepID=UPI003D66BDA4
MSEAIAAGLFDALKLVRMTEALVCKDGTSLELRDNIGAARLNLVCAIALIHAGVAVAPCGRRHEGEAPCPLPAGTRCPDCSSVGMG